MRTDGHEARGRTDTRMDGNIPVLTCMIVRFYKHDANTCMHIIGRGRSSLILAWRGGVYLGNTRTQLRNVTRGFGT